ncbi:MAG: hypothetical protein H7Z43_13395 [Clostridia bacterium]|nr:hypothetical protein [Deltaproteobacteria bacterium]
MPQDFFPLATLDIPKLRELLAALYGQNDPSERWDQALRVTRVALGFIESEQAETKDVDIDTVAGLALVFLVRHKILPTLRMRASVEAYFVSQGWTAVRSRQLMQGLERLLDKPSSIEEKLVADAEAWTRLGVLGFARTSVTSGALGQQLETIAEQLHKNIHRRMFTRVAQSRSIALREELRDMLSRLRKVFDDEGALGA